MNGDCGTRRAKSPKDRTEDTMLEQLHRTPAERRKTEIFLHVGIIAFALFNLTELAAAMGPAPVAAGIAAGLSGYLYSRWLRSRWKEDLGRAAADEGERDARRHFRLQVM